MAVRPFHLSPPPPSCCSSRVTCTSAPSSPTPASRRRQSRISWQRMPPKLPKETNSVGQWVYIHVRDARNANLFLSSPHTRRHHNHPSMWPTLSLSKHVVLNQPFYIHSRTPSHTGMVADGFTNLHFPHLIFFSSEDVFFFFLCFFGQYKPSAKKR